MANEVAIAPARDEATCVPLTPSQYWLLEQRFIDPQNYNNAYVYRLPYQATAAIVQMVFSQLAMRHDALRLCFEQTLKGWQQYLVSDDRLIRVESEDIESESVEMAIEEIAVAARYVRAQLNLTHGPLLQAVVFRGRRLRRNWLLIVASHLNHDARSWQVLVRELDMLIKASVSGCAIELEERGVDFTQWSEALRAYARDGVEQELPYWRSLPWDEVCPLPLDRPRCRWSNTYESMRTRTVKFGPALLQGLKSWKPRLLGAQAGHAILAAVCDAVSDWLKSQYCLIDLTCHGRTALQPECMPAKTVGYLTVTCPFLCRVPTNQGPRKLAEQIAEQVMALPNGGVGYGVLRYLHLNSVVQKRLAKLPASAIKFNYVDRSQTSSVRPASSGLTGETVDLVPTMHPANHRRYMLNVEARSSERGLAVTVKYSSDLHDDSTIQTVINRIGTFLETLAGAA